MTSYRKLTISDLDALQLIEEECFVEPFKREDLIYELNDNPVNAIIGAYSDDKLVGFIDYMVTFNSAMIVQIAVSKEYRHQGIAQILLTLMEQSFPQDIEDKVETITLEVRESNIPAHKLYIKCGYENVLLKKNYYKNGENAIYMIKRIL